MDTFPSSFLSNESKRDSSLQFIFINIIKDWWKFLFGSWRNNLNQVVHTVYLRKGVYNLIDVFFEWTPNLKRRKIRLHFLDVNFAMVYVYFSMKDIECLLSKCKCTYTGLSVSDVWAEFVFFVFSWMNYLNHCARSSEIIIVEIFVTEPFITGGSGKFTFIKM
jgi:hypothetical protein